MTTAPADTAHAMHAAYFGKDTIVINQLTKEQAAIIGAFTGIACGPFSDIHGYAEKVLGRSVWTHQFASKEFCEELREASRADFIALCHKE